VDKELLLPRLRDLPLEEGRAYLREHIADLADYDTVGNLLADEARRLLYTPFVSLKVAEVLISFGDYAGHMPSHALGLKAKGDALMAIGHFRAAMDSLDAARDEFRLLGDEGNAARSRISWTISATWTGRVEEALQEAALARDVFLRLGESYWVRVIDSNTALIYAYVGRHQDAANLYEGMLAIYAAKSDQGESAIKRSIAIAQENYARNLTVLGDFTRAYDLLEQAQANFFSLREMALVVSVEQDLADLDYAQGYYGSALRRYYQAHDSLVQNSIDSPVLLAGIKLSMANCLVKLNRAGEARLLSQEAVEVYRQSGLSFNTGNALSEHAATLVASGRLREALSALDEARMLFTSGGFEPHAFAVRLQQAQILLEIGSAAEAYNTASLVKGYCDVQGLVARAVQATLIMAEALLKDAQYAGAREEHQQQAMLLKEAMSLCKQAVEQARQHNLQEETYRSHYLLGRMCFLEGNFSGAARHYKASIAQIERILDDLVYDLSPSFLRTTWSVYEAMIALCLSQAQFSQAFTYLEQARSMALRQYLNKTSLPQAAREDQAASSLLQASSALIRSAEQELNEWQDRYHYYSMIITEIDTTVSPAVDREVIQAELKRCEVKIGELFERVYLYQSGMGLNSPGISKKERSHRRPKQVDIVQLQRSLAPEQLLLAYFTYQERLVVFAVTAEDLVTRELPGDIEQLERLLPALHAHLDPRTWPDSQNPSQQVVHRLLNKLYDMLVKPVAELLPPSSGHITIVPYGPLFKLPFHALYDGSHFLVEHYQINYLPASTILMYLNRLQSERSKRSTRARGATARPLVLGYSEHGQLQRVRQEAQTVAALLDGRCFLESEATITRLIELAPGSPVIHIATHGHSRLDAPDFSYVRLADGQLNAIDAFRLDLQGCELVTLSGCETGLSMSGGGDEQLGLGRAFLAAGTTSLVMSLWPVEDNATNELMQLFYEGLLKGESKVEALRAAQCNLLRRTGSSYTHPYFWAAFRLVGDVGPLLYEKAVDQLTR
jgi:CHAT domain-containing protein